eukprot:Clim_evm36s7 gene=Clim_evmTU36s7
MAKGLVYLAMSLDGFVAGPDDDLSWLPGPDSTKDDPKDTGPSEFEKFLSQCGAMMMGRKTFDVVSGFGPEMWAYGDLPIFVTTHRDLPQETRPTVRAIAGDDFKAMFAEVSKTAGDKGIYLDGAALVRQAFESGCVDEMKLAIVPIVLGGGVSLFDSIECRIKLQTEMVKQGDHGMVEVKYTVLK